MDHKLAPWLFLGGILLVMLGGYGAHLRGPDTATAWSFLPFSKDVCLQVLGIVFAILGFFGVTRLDPGEEF